MTLWTVCEPCEKSIITLSIPKYKEKFCLDISIIFICVSKQNQQEKSWENYFHII